MRKVFGGVLSALLLAGLTAAQKMTVTGGVLLPGQPVQVTYSDPNRAGSTITVRIDNGDKDNPTVVSIAIPLDPQGNGTGSWIVQGWWTALFNAPGVNEVARFIDGPDAGS
jgi:hypothetical protein